MLGAHRLIPDCKVSVDGTVLPLNDDARLVRLQVDLDLDLFGRCELVFHDPELALLDGNAFQSGSRVNVDIGFMRSFQQIFEGEVVALEPRFRRDVPPTLLVVCQQALHRLGLSHSTRALNNVDDRQIVTAIARDHGFTAEAAQGTAIHSLQSNVTDAVFLKRMAQTNGEYLRIEGRKIVIGPPPQLPDVLIGPEASVSKLKVRIKSLAQVGEITVHAWDPSSKQEIVGRARPQGATGQGAQQHGRGTLSVAGHEMTAPDTATANKIAEGRLRKIAESFASIECEMIGDPRLLPGAIAEIEHLGAGIDGRYRVEKAVHELSKRGYFVRFRGPRVATTTAAARQQQQAARAAQQQPQPTSWIALELLGDDGRPLAGEPYRVVTADGRTIDGTLDAQGRARIEGIRPGQCTVSYPGLGDAWEAAH